MVKFIPVMVTAVILAVVFMLFFSDYISAFIERHPTIKILALSFLLLIGCTLVAEGFTRKFPKATFTLPCSFPSASRV